MHSVIFPSIAAASAVLKSMNEAAGLPKCGHLKWRGGRNGGTGGIRRWDQIKRKRGRVSPCLCQSATEPHPDCTHVTWQVANVLQLADGTVLIDGGDLTAIAELHKAPQRVLTSADHAGAKIVFSERSLCCARTALRAIL